ncbi:hypothetical protein FHS92_001786 [Sphingobium subterraneum]|uniref:Uncharacterized protein n=2 Tax=Sphingobium subterraneum TaxID=627688 RepID=A0A841IZP1_9SPHN|nr:hypothetical protein [Sphingobium subterraneum]
MTDTIQETLALGVAITVMTVVVLRLLAAPFWIWCDDQSDKKRLNSELERPERESEAVMKAFSVDLRKQLSNQLGRLVAMTHMSRAKLPFGGKLDEAMDEFMELDISVTALASQLSYETPTRVAAIQLRDHCFDILTDKERSKDFYSLLWEHRKLTFRIIHGEHHINEMVSLIELEILLEKLGKSLNSKSASESVQKADTLISELKDMFKEIGDRLYEPEIAAALRSELKGDSANSLKALDKKYRSKLSTR